MNKYLVSLTIVLSLLYTCSCQKKQTSQIPTIPILKDFSGSEWVYTCIDEEEPKYPVNQSNHVIDPYKENWDKEKNRYASGRFYRDFDKDGIPELCLQYQKNNDLNSFVIYRINEIDYTYISSIEFSYLEILPTIYYDYCDLLIFRKTGTSRWINKKGLLSLFDYDGKCYSESKSRGEVILEEMVSQKLFTPDLSINQEINSLTGKGTRDDDEKYRKMRYERDKNTFEIRIQIDYDKEEQQKKIIDQSGIRFDNDRLKYRYGRATTDQFKLLKQKEIQIFKKWEWEIVKANNSISSSELSKKIFYKDPYHEFYQEIEGRMGLGRIYQDLNQDGIPEIFLTNSGGNGGRSYSIFQISKTEYKNLGDIFFSIWQILPSKHNGYKDLMLYSHMSMDDGYLSIAEYDGNQYHEVKQMPVFIHEAIKEGIFSPDEDVNPFNGEPFSPKDDDKYRRMIK